MKRVNMKVIEVKESDFASTSVSLYRYDASCIR